MLRRALEVKLALINTLPNFPEIDVTFHNKDWDLMEKVCHVLQCFEEATKMLSGANSSISQAIPFITIIIDELDVKKKEDHGVITFKKILQTAMIDRFSKYESKEEFAIATLLDTRYKEHFFRDKNALKVAKEKLASKLETELKTTEQDISSYSEEPVTEVKGYLETKIWKRIQKNRESLLNLENTQLKDNIEKFIRDYCNSPTEQNVLEFWKGLSQSTDEISQKAAKLAKYYLTPPPSSVDVERLFSKAGDVLTKERNLLRPENAEKILFCHENFKHVNYQYEY